MKARAFYTSILGLFLSLSTGNALAQKTNFLPLEEVKPGQKGIGRTVFQGTEVEEFDVEILGVLEKTGPKQNVILALLSGEKIARSGVFAGMSGSPVYIDDRLIGAIAFAFPFATEPIAGITPIQEMVDVFEEHVGTTFKLVKAVNPASLYEVRSFPSSPFSANDYFFDVGAKFAHLQNLGQMRPIDTPISLSGFSPASVRDFWGYWGQMGMTPMLGAGSARNEDWADAPLEPGSTISVQLVNGDLDVGASGTVTHVDGNKVYAFGHPFMGIGFTELPLSKAGVIGIIPNLMNSQKISASTHPIGMIKQDRATGIMGVTGEEPNLVPVNLSLTTSRGEKKEFQYQIVNDTFLTPFLLAFTVHNSIIASERALGSQTVQLKCEIRLKDQPVVNFQNNISDLTSAPAVAAVAAAAPVNFILNSGFEDIVLEQVDVELIAVEDTRDAVLDKIWQDRLEISPGEELMVTVFLRKPSGDLIEETYPVKIPEGLSPGNLKIMIGDGMSVTLEDAKTEQATFVPENLSQLVKAINNLKKNDRLYIRLFREQEGAIVGGEGLPGLPPSILALYNAQKTTGDTKSINRVVFVEHELPATEYALTGQKIIQVKIKG
jgi:hypothetical protein